MIKNLVLFGLIISSMQAWGQQYSLSGKVIAADGSAVPFTSIFVRGTSQGTSSNSEGAYLLRLKPGKYEITYRSIGFSQYIETIEITNHDLRNDVGLRTEKYQPASPLVGEDPADRIIMHAIEKREFYLNELPAYTCNVYIKGVQQLTHVPRSLFNEAVAHRLEMDTSRSKVLYLFESGSTFSFEHPNKEKVVTISSKIAGGNNALNFTSVADLQVNFYQNICNIERLNTRGFISPIADNALDYYHYKLIGTTTENGKQIDKIQVTPIRPHDPVFTGDIYIIDGNWRLYNTHLFVTKEAGLNFVDTLNIDQQYVPITHTIWQPASVTYTYSGNVVGYKYKGYVLGIFSDYDVAPKFAPHFFNGENIYVTQENQTRDSIYWAQTRLVPLTAEERKNYKLRDSIEQKHETPAYLDSVERVNNKLTIPKFFLFGDSVKNRRNKTTLYFHPFYETVFFNTVEGLGFDLKVDRIKQYDAGKELTLSPELRYGFSNNQWEANIGFRYKYDAFKKGEFYGSFGSNIFDLNSEASVGVFTNTLGTLVFKNNVLKIYRSKFAELGLQRNVARGLLLDGSLEWAQREALLNTTYFVIRDVTSAPFTSNNPLKPELPDTSLLFTFNKALTFRFSATYTFGEEYTSTPTGAIYDPSPYPRIKLSYRKGIHNVLGSVVDYDYADVQVFQDHIKLGLFGFSSFVLKAGKFLNATALIYPDYKQFKGNEGITFDPTIGSFHFLPYYTFANSEFLEAHYEHNFSGFLFNKVPYLRDLKLQEIAGVNYLTQHNNNNYSEFYIGIQRFFFRLDYGLAYQGGSRVNQGFVFYYGF